MSAAKKCIKIGRKGSFSTMDFIKVFGGDVTLNDEVKCKNKDRMIITMANTIMELTMNGKFNLRDF